MKLFFLSLLFIGAKDIPAAVGIDLGTTFCCVSIFKNGDTRPSFLQFSNGQYVFPSVAYYNQVGDKGFYVTGWEAFTHNLDNTVPGRYFYGFKRAMGVADIKEISRVDNFENSVTYKIEKKIEDGKCKTIFIVTNEKGEKIDTTDPESLSAEILRELKNEIEKYYKIINLVITVPAYFTSFQIEATIKSALMAGLPEPTIAKEPVAAAYAYQVTKNITKSSDEENFMVFDLGGGTFDVSVVDMENNALFVTKYGGNNYLGGENVNDNLTNYFANILMKEKNIDILKNQTQNLRLRRFVEDFKINLCTQYTKDKSNNIHKDTFIYEGLKGIELSLTIDKFNELNSKFYKDIEDVLEHPDYGMFRTTKGRGNDEPLDRKNITKIMLVGGSTRIPYIKDLLNKLFPGVQLYDDINADTIVAEGACLLSANDMKMLPDNMAVQLIDVVPAHIGIRTDEDIFEPVLEKDTYIPGSGTKEFTTSHDNQTKVRIMIAQGFRESFKANHYLGACELDVQPGQPRGVPRISITISMSTDGTISVSAKDVNTNKETGIKFDSAVARLDKKKYAELLEDAEKNREADKELKEKFYTQRQFEEEIHALQIKLGQPGISEDDKINVEGIINGATKWLNDNKSTASKVDIEDKLARFRESVAAIMDKKDEHQQKEEPKEDEKSGGREEL